MKDLEKLEQNENRPVGGGLQKISGMITQCKTGFQ